MHATRSEDPEERPVEFQWSSVSDDSADACTLCNLKQLTHLHNEDEDERTSTQQLAFDDCNLSNKIFLDNTSGANQLDFVRWGIDSDDSGSDTVR
ncbi:unnamed protein product [Phytophthora lilii]|uniref:Unnamed protein product n=1 Tax=Phytophthora lilii TaxID=2077276 RepID=A0A9W7CHG7_9STRA|nr:unnamed protein product [Phytophthora lilii]